MTSFFGLSNAELLAWVDRPARAARVYTAVYRQQAPQFDRIETIPSNIRAVLSRSLSLELPGIHQTYDSGDGTRRFLLRLSDGETVEAVRIPSPGRDTFCISSQIGCALACTFCLTGQLGLIRDLSAGEIVSQVVLLVRQAPGRRFSIVLMGMGEPLQNYDNVMRAIRILQDANGMAIAPSRITLSTAGLVPGIRRLGQEPTFPNLSISLTGVTNAKRDELMPINRKYPVEEVIAAIRELPVARQSRVMFECVMIRGVTDSLDDARELASLLRGMRAKVNLIPLNPAPEIPYRRPADGVILGFQEVLVRAGVATFIRKNRGNDVSGACGQLKMRELAG